MALALHIPVVDIIKAFSILTSVHMEKSIVGREALTEKFLIDVPGPLHSQLDDLREAFYEEESEATCRVTIEIRPFMQFLESNVSVRITKQPAEWLITGRADWAMRYKSLGDEGSLLNAMETKQGAEFSKGEAQLTAYLAILRENRRRAKKVNCSTQGFYSDGTRFGFLCITEEGVVRHSRIFDIGKRGELKMVFSFIVNMVETAMKMTPNGTATKSGPQRDLEIENDHDEVWTKNLCMR